MSTQEQTPVTQDEPWEYGFYDDDPERTGVAPADPVIFWYVFGLLSHKTAESAEHTGLKSTWGQPVIVRRRKGEREWEHVQGVGADE